MAARIGVAKAQIAEARAGGRPSVDVGAGSTLQKTTGLPFVKQFDLGTQVSWDLDVWGKVEKGVQGQTAEFHATEADWRAGYLQIVADVSITYFQILQLDEQIDRQQRALAKNENILTIYETMRSNGLTSDTEYCARGGGQPPHHGSAGAAPNSRRDGERPRNPARCARRGVQGPARPAAGPCAGATVPVGLPLDLLARRPDVVAGEFRVLEAMT